MTTTTTTPALYDAVVAHTRHADVHRTFRHRVYTWLVDLDNLPTLPRWLQPFAHFTARDHMGDPHHSIRVNVDSWLATHDIDLRGGRVLMLAHARVLGYVFNPVTVYWCHDADGRLTCVIAEVHNTYGERHCYLLHPDSTGRAETDKQFYVSPFLPMRGRYVMRLDPPGEQLGVHIELRDDTRPLLTASLTGHRRAVTPRALARMVLTRPLVPQRVSALIRRHGLAMWLRRTPRIPHPPHVRQEGRR